MPVPFAAMNQGLLKILARHQSTDEQEALAR